jgi:hypothetical protein
MTETVKPQQWIVCPVCYRDVQDHTICHHCGAKIGK